MACCPSRSGDPVSEKRSKEIDKAMYQQAGKSQTIKRLLLLGAGESGKSTLFKQMIGLYGKGFSETDRRSYRPMIYQNLLDSINTLIKASGTLNHQIQGADAQRNATWIRQNATFDHQFSQEVARCIKTVWLDPGIQQTFEKRARFQIADCASYFFSHIDRVSDLNYTPTLQDVLRCRIRTSGIVETEFVIEKTTFQMIDVGGQRNERRKWIHCFDEVTAMIFVAAISEYDQVLWEDGEQNRIHEALDLFAQVTNARWFKGTSIILFLNKRDLLEEKIKTVPLTVCFEDYDGPNTYEAACDFFKEVFLDEYEGERSVYTHVTCATDTHNISHVFNSVKDTVLRESLAEVGIC